LKIIARICIDKAKCRKVHAAGFVDAASNAFEEGSLSMDSVFEMFGILSMLAMHSEEASELIC